MDEGSISVAQIPQSCRWDCMGEQRQPQADHCMCVQRPHGLCMPSRLVEPPPRRPAFSLLLSRFSPHLQRTMDYTSKFTLLKNADAMQRIRE